MTAPKKQRRVAQLIGKRFSVDKEQAGDVVYARGPKLARRMHRRQAMIRSSSIEASIVTARRLRLESERYATNSHEAKRYVLAERAERQKARP